MDGANSVGIAKRNATPSPRPQLHRNLPAVAIRDRFADRQLYAGAGIFHIALALAERLENPLRELLLEADALVDDRQVNRALLQRRRDRYLGRPSGLAIFDRIGDDVLHQAGELRAIADKGRRRNIDLEPGLAGGDRLRQLGERELHFLAQLQNLQLLIAIDGSRIGEQILDQLAPAHRGAAHLRARFPDLRADARGHRRLEPRRLLRDLGQRLL